MKLNHKYLKLYIELMFGVHVTKKSLFSDKTYTYLHDSMLDHVNTLKLNALQIFTHGPRNYRENSINYEQIALISKKVNIYVHGSYPSIGIWNEEKHDIYKAHLDDMLLSANKCNASGLVLHLPKKSPKFISDVAHKLHIKSKCPILFEMPASKPDMCTFETPEKLGKLHSLLTDLHYDWGWCIDTAHLWSCGVKLNDNDVVNNWLSNLREVGKIKLFHLNSSRTELFNTGKDVHEIVFGDNDGIWNKNPSACKLIVDFCKTNKIPMICEINRGKNEEVERSFEMLRKI